MDMLSNKKGYIHHPVVLFIIGMLLGVLIAFLIAKHIIPIPVSMCFK